MQRSTCTHRLSWQILKFLFLLFGFCCDYCCWWCCFISLITLSFLWVVFHLTIANPKWISLRIRRYCNYIYTFCWMYVCVLAQHFCIVIHQNQRNRKFVIKFNLDASESNQKETKLFSIILINKREFIHMHTVANPHGNVCVKWWVLYCTNTRTPTMDFRI